MSGIFALIKQVDSDIFRNRKKIYMIYMLVQFVIMCISFIYNSYVAMILSLVSVCFTHAYVICSKKIVESKEDAITYKDALVGILKFKDLFPAYIIRKVIINVVTFSLVAPVFLGNMSGTSFFDELFTWLRAIILNDMDSLYNVTFLNEIIVSPFRVISVVLASLITMLLTLSFSFVPYLLEEEDLSWLEALKKSFAMAKNHLTKLFIIRLFYLARMGIVNILILLCTRFLQFNTLFSYILWFILSLYLPVVLYLPHYELSIGYCYQKIKDGTL